MHLRPQSNRRHANARPRARAHRRRFMQATTNHVSPTPCHSERHCKDESGKRLGSRSRDPIGYEGSEWNLYEFLFSSPTCLLDPFGLCPEPRTEKECCDAAKQNGDDDDDAGGVICCDGRKVSCVWLSGGTDPDDPDAPSDPIGIGIIDSCIKEHEDVHHVHVPDCPSKIPHLKRPNTKPGIGDDRAECDAYKKEEKCLLRNIRKCRGNPQCVRDVRDEIELVRKRRAKHCKRAFELEENRRRFLGLSRHTFFGI